MESLIRRIFKEPFGPRQEGGRFFRHNHVGTWKRADQAVLEYRIRPGLRCWPFEGKIVAGGEGWELPRAPFNAGRMRHPRTGR